MLLVQPSLKFSAGRAKGATANNDTPATSARAALPVGMSITETLNGNMVLHSTARPSIRQGQLGSGLGE